MTNPNMTFARALVAALHAHGVNRFVLCPGSRSGPLALALGEAASEPRRPDAPEVELHVRIDERSAAFLALGMARATFEPVAVVTTSGTAVGNLLPAAMEAAHSGVPLVLLTADRPPSVRGTGANQTTDQRDLFGGFASRNRDAAPPTWGRDLVREAEALAGWALGPTPDAPAGLAGVAHLNLPFAEPIEPDSGPWPIVSRPPIPTLVEPRDLPLPDVAKGIVVAGDRAGRVAATIAEARGWPLFAEPTSGARFGQNGISGYAEALATERGRALAADAEFVVAIGRPTLSRPVASLLVGAKRLWVAEFGGRPGETPLSTAESFDLVPDSWRAPVNDRDPEWLERWRLLATEPRADGWGAESIVLAARGAARSGALLLGSSGVIRAADRVFPVVPDPGDGPVVVANRGLSGIDGTVSTAMGLGLAGHAPVVAAMGDLTFLHDVGGLLTGPRERRPNVTLVVVNDGGGTIFSSLEHARADADIFERVFTTPHEADIEAIAFGYGATYARATHADELDAAFARTGEGVWVVEAVLQPG